MSTAAEVLIPGEAARQACPGKVPRAENLAASLALASVAVLPVAEIVLRATMGTGIPGAPQLVQHLTLVTGMLGAALAAREGRLLSLSTAALLPARWKRGCGTAAGAVGALVAAFLALGSFQFAWGEREFWQALAQGIPCWVFQLALPVGFGAVALRLLWAGGGQRRAVRLLALGAAVAAVALLPSAPGKAVIPALIALLVATLLGLPIFALLGGASLLLFWAEGVPISSLAVDHYRLVTSPTLPAIPLFTLAGYLLAAGGASTRLVRVFQALTGWLRGGPALVTAASCAFFTAFTGASGVTILALGGLLLPLLVEAGYGRKNALGLVTGAGSLGVLLPPSLPLILYAIVAGVGMEDLFLAGLLPGVLLAGLTAAWGIRRSPRSTGTRTSFDRTEVVRAVLAAKWELLVPVVAVAALFSGLATPVEAAALTALYAFGVEVFVHRSLRLTADVPGLFAECALVVGGVLLILGVALGFTNYLIDAQVASRAVELVTANIHSKVAFLAAVNIFLLAVGCLMDIFSATVVVVPLLVPLGSAFGVDPLHLGVIFLANLELGYLTPPVGMNLFLAAYRFGKPMGEVIRATLPLLFWLLVGVLLITYVPSLSTALPGWFR